MTVIIFGIKHKSMVIGEDFDRKIGFPDIPELKRLIVTGHQVILFVGVIVY